MKLHWGGLGQWSRLSVVDKGWVPLKRWAFAHKDTHMHMLTQSCSHTNTASGKSRHVSKLLCTVGQNLPCLRKAVTFCHFLFHEKVLFKTFVVTSLLKVMFIHYSMTGAQTHNLCLSSLIGLLSNGIFFLSASFSITLFSCYFFLQLFK